LEGKFMGVARSQDRLHGRDMEVRERQNSR